MTMTDINLLPASLAPSKTFSKASKKLKMLSLVGFSFLVVVLAVSLVIIFILNRRLNSSAEQQESLETSIRAFERTATRL